MKVTNTVVVYCRPLSSIIYYTKTIPFNTLDKSDRTATMGEITWTGPYKYYFKR